MRTAAFVCSLVALLWASTALAVDRTAVYAEKGGLNDDETAKYRAVFTERLRTGGFIVVEVAGTVADPDSVVRSLDLSLGRHGPYRLFAVAAAPRGKSVGVTIAEVDPKTLKKIDSITALVSDAGEFDRVLPRLITAFIPNYQQAPEPPATPPPPPVAPVPEPSPAPRPVEVPHPYAPPKTGLFAASPDNVPCYKEPGEFLWGLGVMSGFTLAGDTEGELGLQLRFAFETGHARIDLDGLAMGGGDSRLYELMAGVSYLFSTDPTSFYLGGGLGVMWMYGRKTVQLYGRGMGADVRAGVEFLRHHRARFLIEARAVLPFYKEDPDYSSISSQYIPAAALTLQLLW